MDARRLDNGDCDAPAGALVWAGGSSWESAGLSAAAAGPVLVGVAEAPPGTFSPAPTVLEALNGQRHLRGLRPLPAWPDGTLVIATGALELRRPLDPSPFVC